MPIGIEGLLAAARRQPDSPYTPTSPADVPGESEATEVAGNEREALVSQEVESDAEEETGSEENDAPSFPSHPLAAHVEVAMDEDEEEDEEEEEELYEIDLVLPGDTEPTAFYTSDMDNGIIYEIDSDESPGEEVGQLKNGVPNWATE